MTHETKDGRILMIANMESSHLKNTVKMLLRNINEAKEALNGMNGNNVKVFGALYGQKTQGLEQRMLNQIEKNRQLLPYYIMECMIRGIDFKEELCKTFDRPVNQMEVKNPLFDLFQKELDKTPQIQSLPNAIQSISKSFHEEDVLVYENESPKKTESIVPNSTSSHSNSDFFKHGIAFDVDEEHDWGDDMVQVF